MTESSLDSLTVRKIRNDADWQQAHAIRTRVFVEEQAVSPNLEYDEHDWPIDRGETCNHLLAEVGDRVVGTARWRRVEKPALSEVEGESSAYVKLERFAVLPEWRGRGIGKALVEAALNEAKSNGHHRFLLHSQAYLEDFYASFGFETVGEPFQEAGIPHVKMILTVGLPK